MPHFVLEVQPNFVAGARLESSKHVVGRLGVRELEPHAVVPAVNAQNIGDAEKVQAALHGVQEVVGEGAGKLGLLLPDGAVRVTLFSFETLPDDSKQADALVRWRMKEHLPYPPEEAKVSYQILWRDSSGIGLLVIAAKNSLITEYAEAIGIRNGGPDLVLPSTAALLPLVPDSDGEAHLLVHVCSGWVTSAVISARRLEFWRTKSVAGSAAEVAAGVNAEVTRVLASCRDFLHIEPAKVWLCARGAGEGNVQTSVLTSSLSSAISKEISALTFGEKTGEGLSGPEQVLLASVGAPFAGLMANGR